MRKEERVGRKTRVEKGKNESEGKKKSGKEGEE